MSRRVHHIQRWFLIVLMVLLGSAGKLCAAEQVVVRLTSEPENPWIGQQVIVYLDLLGRDGWAQLHKIDYREVDGGYLKRFETQGTRLQETIAGESYSGQRYEYMFFPQRAGELVLASMAIDVEIKGWGADAKEEIVTMSTPPLALKVRPVEGVETGEPVISTTEFSIIQKWEPEATEFAAGDALTRTIEFSAAGVSGMVFQPVTQQPIEGIGIYPSSPAVDDVYSRGDLSGRRVETFTYVMEQAGSHRLEDSSFVWWNIKDEVLETVTLEGRTFSVEAATAAAVSGQKRSTAAYFKYGGAALLLLAFFFLLRLPVKRSYQRWAERRRASEKHLFKAVTKNAADHDDIAFLNALMHWLDTITEDNRPARLDLFLSRYGSDDAQKACAELTTAAGTPESGAKIEAFLVALKQARSNFLTVQKKKQRAEQLLPPVGLQAK